MKKLSLLLCAGLFACVSWVGAQNETGVGESERIVKFKKAAEKGSATAQYNLGVCYYNGIDVNVNYEEAFKWYLMAAEQGVVDAQYMVAICYARGKGTLQSPMEAVRWYRAAAEQQSH